ncbi:hypothetical protein PHISP_03696 [Aspergillus sp. HF37]|nr:hypothetical protein PHISP_03696 [Aspergillus sp. HF37]
MSPPPANDRDPRIEAEAYEERNVHEVYQQIAGHFSSTRYKPWPIVERFLQDLAPGAIGLDVGCGNGKYLTVNKNVFVIASDRSENLARIALQHQPHSTVVADVLNLPHPDSFFDFAVSIAVVHHLSTAARRVEALWEVLRTLRPGSNGRPGGRALVYVWALEQKNSRRGWDKGDDQDVMVPWVMKNSPNQSDQQRVFHRYYHLYEEGELAREISCAGGRVLESGYEKDNWWAIAAREDS